MIKRLAFILVIAVCVLQPTATASTHYVLLNSGRLCVFPDSCLSQWSDQGGALSFTALDGSRYTYLMSNVASYGDELPRPLPTITSFKINNKYNYQVVGDATGVINGDLITFQIAGIGKRLTPSFVISGNDDDAEAWVNGVKQVSKKSRLRFDGDVVYLVGYPGDKVLSPNGSGHYEMTQYGRTYTVRADFLTDHATTVPRIDINTVGGVAISSKEYYLDAEIIIDGAGVFPSMTDSVQVKGRGNSSWSTDSTAKNPYRLRFDSKRKPLGLKNGKSWILLANKIRGSMLTNPIGMKAASLLGLPAPNHMIPVELYVNGVYKGSYTFTEKPGFSNNSVDIDNEEVAAFMDFDRYFDEPLTQEYPSPGYYLPVIVKEPEFDKDETLLTLDIVKERFNAFESTVKSNGDISAHVDVESLARFMIMNEYILNREILWPKSTYFYHTNMLSDTGRFYFGPAWDLDYAYGAETNSNYFYTSTTQNFYTTSISASGWRFFSALHNRTDVGKQTYKVWKSFMGDNLDELCEFCQDYYNYAAPSLEHNSENWSEETFNYSYQANTKAPDWLRQRAQALYNQLAALYRVPGDVNGDGNVTIADVTELINYLLTDDAEGVDLDAADMNGDGGVSIADVTTIINHLLTN